jgi:hypothetical protein
MAHHDAHSSAHRTADDEYLPVEGSTYEHTDANVRAIVKFGLWLAITALIVHVGVGLMYAMLVEQAQDTTEQRYPLAAGAPPKLPPEPRLQQFPRNEIYELRLSEQQKLTQYGWVDKEAGVVRIPIDEAMRLTIERLPARAEDAENPPAAPGMLASDASAGRVMERRRQ